MPLVINTRAKHQAEALNMQLKAADFTVLNFPTLIITEANNLETKKLCENISQFNIAIFTSANAVISSKAYLPSSLNIATVIAVGPATKTALEQQGTTNVIIPKQFNSEGILALTELANINNKKIIIFCGENPRPLLYKELTAKGARVTCCECYQRQCPAPDTNALTMLEESQANAIISTSPESLNNLTTLIAEHPLLKKTPIVVISEKMSSIAKRQGWQKIIISENPTNKAIVKALKEHVVHSQ